MKQCVSYVKSYNPDAVLHNEIDGRLTTAATYVQQLLSGLNAGPLNQSSRGQLPAKVSRCSTPIQSLEIP
jgi:hypothetical protein